MNTQNPLLSQNDGVQSSGDDGTHNESFVSQC